MIFIVPYKIDLGQQKIRNWCQTQTSRNIHVDNIYKKDINILDAERTKVNVSTWIDLFNLIRPIFFKFCPGQWEYIYVLRWQRARRQVIPLVDWCSELHSAPNPPCRNCCAECLKILLYHPWIKYTLKVHSGFTNVGLVAIQSLDPQAWIFNSQIIWLCPK